jgi:hypothetical protein
MHRARCPSQRRYRRGEEAWVYPVPFALPRSSALIPTSRRQAGTRVALSARVPAIQQVMRERRCGNGSAPGRPLRRSPKEWARCQWLQRRRGRENAVPHSVNYANARMELYSKRVARAESNNYK